MLTVGLVAVGAAVLLLSAAMGFAVAVQVGATRLSRGV